MRIGVVGVFVDDQDTARAFHPDVVGFPVNDDARYGDSARWLTVVAPEQPDGPQLRLAPTNHPAAALPAARREASTPASSSRPSTVTGRTRSPEVEGPCSCPSHNPWATAAATPCSRTAGGICSTVIRTEGPRCGC